jgi:hypothetical protein
MRYLLVLSVLVLCGALQAQDFFSLTSRTVQSDRTWIMHFTVTQSGSEVVLNADVENYSQSGLRVRLIDVQSRAETNPLHSEQTVSFPTTLNINLSLPARTGTYSIIMTVQTLMSGTSTFLPHLNVPSGSMSFVQQQTIPGNAKGLVRPLGLYASYISPDNRPVDYTSTVTLNLGSTPQSIEVGYYASGSSIVELRVYDDETDTLLGTLLPAPTGNIDTSTTVSLPSASGEFRLRIESEGDDYVGNITWSIWPPSGVTVTAISGDGISGGGGDGGGGGCAALPSVPLAPWLLAAALGAAAMRRRLF